MSGLFGSKKTISNSETRIGALRVQQSSQGVPIALVWGTTRISPNLIGYYDFTAIPKTTTQNVGKGGGTRIRNTTYTYTVSPMFALCEGPVQNTTSFIGQVWSGKELKTAGDLGATQFGGTYNQPAWSYLLAAHANEALRYPGQCYVAIANLDLGDNTSLPNFTFEVTGFGQQGGGDENPADVLRDALTNPLYGAGWPKAQFCHQDQWRLYCAGAGVLISPAITAQTTAADIANDMARIGNAAPVWSDGQLKMIPRADEPVGSFTPNLTVRFDFTADDFIADAGTAPVLCTRKRQADAFNQVQIEVLDRDNQYNSQVVDSKDTWSIEQYGLRAMDVIRAHAICNRAVGKVVAQTILQRQLYVRNEYRFKVGLRFVRLEPMDVVSLTDELLGLDHLRVRVIDIDESDDGVLEVTAEDLQVGVSTPGVYATPPSSAGAKPNTNLDPGDTNAPVIFQPPLPLTGGSPQIWIGASGGPEWGGAQIWISTDNATYEHAGELTAPARYGVLTANFPLQADPDTVNTLAVNLSASNGSLTTVPQSAANAFATLSYVGQNTTTEIVAYSNVSLTSAYHYDLATFIRRAISGSRAAAHATGYSFMRLDDAVAHIDVPPALFGTTIYIKLLSFNKTGGGLQQLDDVTPYTFAIAAQVLTDGTGYAYIADTGSTATGPASGRLRWNASNQPAATALYLSNTTADGANVAAFFSGLANTGYVELRDASDPGKWATYRITASAAGNSSHTLTVTSQANGVAIPNADTVMVKFTPVGVRGVGLNMPTAVFTVANSPVTENGTITVTLNAQNAATFFAGPLTGNAAPPTFRAFALSDISVGANGQTIATQNGAVVWANVTASGSSYLAVRNATANTTLVLTDSSNMVEYNSASAGQIVVPVDSNVNHPVGTSIILAQLGNGQFTVVPENGNVTIRSSAGNQSYAQYSELALQKRAANDWYLTGERLAVLSGGNGGGNGSVTSVGLTMPAIFTVANTPVTASGNIAVSLANQVAGVVFAGPVSGANAAPTFRQLAGSDFGTQNSGLVLVGPSSGNAANASFRALTGADLPKLMLNTQTGNYTLTLADWNNHTVVRMSSANATVLTVPSFANVGAANGASVLIVRAGAGNVTISAQASVTVSNSSSSTLRAQGSPAALLKTGVDTIDLFGDLT